MVDEETRRKLRELGMGEMVEALDLQESDGISMAVAFDDRIWMMVDYAYEAKYISSVKRLAARAKLRFPDAEMGEMIYDGRKIDGVLICEAGTCQFVASAANGVIEGLTGADKSYLACCIAKQACKMRRSTRYVHLPDLQMERDELAATERSNAKILRNTRTTSFSSSTNGLPKASTTRTSASCSSRSSAATRRSRRCRARSTRQPNGTGAWAAACRPMPWSIGWCTSRRASISETSTYASCSLKSDSDTQRAKPAIRKRRERRYANRETGGAHAAK